MTTDNTMQDWTSPSTILIPSTCALVTLFTFAELVPAQLTVGVIVWGVMKFVALTGFGAFVKVTVERYGKKFYDWLDRKQDPPV